MYSTFLTFLICKNISVFEFFLYFIIIIIIIINQYFAGNLFDYNCIARISGLDLGNHWGIY